MEKYGVNQLREMFLSFFETKGHLRLPSFSLIPQNDASLLLINSGMAPMKPYFKGEQEPPRHRVTTCQKCIRTGDIENIGHTARHGTYFEMLGNFSFGDYFKKEAIHWAWEFLTSPEWVGLEADRLYVDNKFQMSSNIVNSDYYAHVFGKASNGGTLEDTVVFTDITGIFNQASVLYMYRKGYVDPEAPDTFGGKATARLGEFIDVLYRIAGRPETDNTALPADYENEEFNATHPYFNAVCWAYQTRLLRQNDPNAEYDDKVDYQTACVLIRRYAIMAGVDTGVDQAQLRQLLRDAPDLGREAAKAMLWCDEKDITTRDSSLDELLASAGTRISRYQMTSFLFYLCTYELDIGS